MKKLLASTIIVTGFTLAAAAGASTANAAETCGNISIAEMNWASAGVAAYVDKFIMENGYDCTVDIVTGDTTPTFTSMNEKGQPDMAPEMWVNTLGAPYEEAVKSGNLIQDVKILSEGGVEGWWIPKYLADAHPDIKTVEDALKHPELFPAPEDASKGAVFGCPPGWGCQPTTANLFKARKADEKGFTLVDTGSGAGLDGSISNAYEKKAGWLGYYWAPTAIMGKYDMVKLDDGVPLDREAYDTCIVKADCADPKPNAYPIADVYTVVTKAFAEKAGPSAEYVKKRAWDNGTLAKVLAWMDENQGTNEDGAAYFLENHEDIWTKWVSPEVAEKIKASI
ncbi:ABC transporter substrate-binding protein [Agrobacterium sp. CG674]